MINGLGMKMDRYGGMHMEHHLSPPASATIEEAVSKSPKINRRTIDNKVIGLVKDYISSENPKKPYSDLEILDYLKNQGYESLKRSDIAFARFNLKIAPSSQRYSLN